MTFLEAQQFLYSFVNWEATGGRPTDPNDLARFRSFLAGLGNPHRDFRSILVVGTNGKGSVSAMLASMLASCGLRVGLFTSPHLVSITERIQVDGRPLSPEEFASGVEHLKSALPSAGMDLQGYRTTFELLTALAFLSFARARVDIAVLEAGMGARLDATSVVDPVLSVITPIHLDHTATLGPTLAAIARDKAGAIRTGIPVVVAPQPAAIRRVLEEEAARNMPSALVRVGRHLRYRSWPAGDGFWGARFSDGGTSVLVDRLPLRGSHQVVNAATALAAARRMVSEAASESLIRGLRESCWPGRLDVVEGNPTILLDGAHNPHGARALAAFLTDWAPLRGRNRTFLTAFSTGKDVEGILGSLRPFFDSMVACRAVEHRGLPAGEVARTASGLGYHVLVTDGPRHGFEVARSTVGSDGVVVICGSLYLVGAVAGLLGLDRAWWVRDL